MDQKILEKLSTILYEKKGLKITNKNGGKGGFGLVLFA